jgi:hypothetical protein
MALTAIDFDKLVIDKVMSVTGLDRTTGELDFMFDEIKDATLENGGETVFGTGAGGRRISAMDQNKTSRITFNNGYVIASALAAQIGADVSVASDTNKLVVPTVETVTVVDGVATLPDTPIVSSVKYAYKANKDMTQGTKYEVDATAGAGKFTLSGSTATFPVGDFETGDAIIIAYEYETTVGKALINNSEKYSKNVKLIIDLLCRDVCDNSIVYHTKKVYHNAKPDMNVSISVGGEPAVHNFAAESLTDPCSKDKTYWTWFIVE